MQSSYSHDFAIHKISATYKKFNRPNNSIADLSLSEISVYPNPARGKLSIVWSGATQAFPVQVYDIYGRKAPLLPPKGGNSPPSEGLGEA